MDLQISLETAAALTLLGSIAFVGLMLYGIFNLIRYSIAAIDAFIREL